MDPFAISPWWWIAAAILLAAIEMVTVSTVLIWSSLAALITALVLWATPGLGLAAQIGLFALLSIAFTFTGRWIIARYGASSVRASSLNRRAAQLVGREGVVVFFDFHEGQVSIDGVPWPARLDGARTPEAGSRVRVVAADGIVVWVKPIAPEAKLPSS